MTVSRVCIIAGGESAEADASRRSADNAQRILNGLGCSTQVIEHDVRLTERLRHTAPGAIVWPLTHGGTGEDGSLQGMLTCLGVSYIGSTVLASSVCMHKPTAHRVLSAHGLRVPRHVVVSRWSSEFDSPGFPGPWVVKPTSGGSSMFVSRAVSSESLWQDVRAIHAIGDDALVEELVDGVEFTIGIDHRHDGPQALAPLEVVGYLGDHGIPSVGERPLHVVRSESALVGGAVESALAAHAVLGCQDWSRVDVIVDRTGRSVVLEVNTIPGMSPKSPYMVALDASGVSLADWVEAKRS